MMNQNKWTISTFKSQQRGPVVSDGLFLLEDGSIVATHDVNFPFLEDDIIEASEHKRRRLTGDMPL